jgi:hypothetical protein
MRRKQFKLLLSAGTVRALREEGGFDLFNLKPSLPMPPASYGGVSGGAVWRFLTERNGDQLVVTGKQLIGVPFYEIGPDDGPLDLICHGPQSIYNRLAKVVIDKWG